MGKDECLPLAALSAVLQPCQCPFSALCAAGHCKQLAPSRPLPPRARLELQKWPREGGDFLEASEEQWEDFVDFRGEKKKEREEKISQNRNDGLRNVEFCNH